MKNITIQRRGYSVDVSDPAGTKARQPLCELLNEQLFAKVITHFSVPLGIVHLGKA
jgi:hypothetical protein